ncbi:MAG: hypothetical protein AAB484_00935 [Patescibacteria group bacterium]
MISQYLDSLLGTFSAHPYIILFVGLLFAGETFLLPAIYFALADKLHLSYVFAIAMSATMIADVFWYYVGAHMKNRFAKKIVVGRIQRAIEKLSEAYARQGGRVLYFSKFVYGTRTAAQILSGLQLMLLRKYLVVNFLGIFSLLISMVILAYSIDATVESIGSIVHDVQITFFIFVVLLVSAHLAFGAHFKKIWFR